MLTLNDENNNENLINVWEEFYDSIPEKTPVHEGLNHVHIVIDNLRIGLDLLEERLTAIISALVDAHNDLLLKLYHIEKQIEKGEIQSLTTTTKEPSQTTNNSTIIQLHQELKKSYQEIAELKSILKEFKGDKTNDI